MLVNKIMQVLKNLFGLNKKISASEIAIKNSDGEAIALDEYLRMQRIETIWTGTLTADNSITLENTKRFLVVYFHIDFSNYDGIIKYTIDKNLGNIVYGGGLLTPFDEAYMNTYYVCEGKFDKTTNKFTNTRCGYFNITNGGYTSRNGNSGYYVYRIDTHD